MKIIVKFCLIGFIAIFAESTSFEGDSVVIGYYRSSVISVGKWRIDTSDWENSHWFDTKNFINFRNRHQIEAKLKKEKSFQDVFFDTEDGYKLHGLWRTSQSADFTIIFCAGWSPGKQTGMATFVEMMPENCNILFFNGRGKGKSTGKLSLLNVFNYGVHEHKDVIAAINYAQQGQKPIILHGICVGAYLAARAACALSEEKTATTKNVAGLVFDSGFVSINGMAESLPENAINCAIKYNILKNFFYKMFICARKLLYDPWMKRHEKTINISEKLPQTKIPTLFIHSDDDKDAPYENIKSMVQQTLTNNNKSDEWLINYSADSKNKHARGHHGVHHLKKKEQYCNKLLDFIKKLIFQED